LQRYPPFFRHAELVSASMARRQPLGAAPDIFHTKTQRCRVGREAAFDSDHAAGRGVDGETGISAHAFLFVSLCETKEHGTHGKGRPWTLKRVQGDVEETLPSASFPISI
jgi:hypothetical protein